MLPAVVAPLAGLAAVPVLPFAAAALVLLLAAEGEQVVSEFGLLVEPLV